MADPSPVVPERLDSWKAIADYLRRDVGTVRRWEKALGLPVRRVPGGRGRSVFAYSSEIDAWLKTAPAVSNASISASRPAWRGWLAVIALIAVAIGVAARARTPQLRASELRIQATPDGIVAFDAAGTARWRHPFSAAYRTALSEVGVSSRVLTGEPPAVYVATSHRERRSDGQLESGELTSLDLEGRVKRSFAFSDQVTVQGTKYGPPWALTTFAVDESAGTRRVAVAAHHFLWDPSLVTLLDDQWRRRGTFMHAGWIESVSWLGSNRLLVGGFSEPHDGGMVALLDAGALDGQGPEPPGTRHHCETCGTQRPLRMVVMPRSEVNRVSVSRFNRAAVQVTPQRIVARTIEVPSDVREAVDALYEFTRSLDLIRASFSTRYWEVHRALEGQGKLDHPRERCPDRDGPREIQSWEPETGWKTLKIRRDYGRPLNSL